MKKTKLTLVFVIAFASFVPEIALSQANPGAKAETSASKPAPNSQ